MIRTPGLVVNFDEVAGPSLSIPSVWRGKITTRDADTLTKPLKTKDQSTETVRSCHKEVQADLKGGRGEDDSESKGEEEGPMLDLGNVKGMGSDLQRFLKRCGPMMACELDRSRSSRAFEDLVLLRPHDDDGSDQCTLKYVLTVDLAAAVKALENVSPPQREVGRSRCPLEVTGVAWNASGSLLVASYGRFDLCGWCDIAGALCVWNIFKRGFNTSDPSSMAPDFVLDHSSCLMSVACHPERPSVIAAGSFNGEVLVYDVAAGKNEETLIASSSIDDYFHREPVVRVCWVWDMREQAYQLASISGDGKVLFWTLANNLECPVQGFRLVAKPPKKVATEHSRRRGQSDIVVGGTALAFPMEGRIKATAVVGSEGGAVFRCVLPTASTSSSSTAGGGDSKWSPEAEEAMARVPEAQRLEVKRHVEAKMRELKIRTVTLKSVYEAKPDPALLFPAPDTVTFDKHHGPVHSLDCSPFHRNLFLSCSADGTARLYSLLQTKPLLSLEPSVTAFLHGAAWSKSRPQVLATVADTGMLYIYDLERSQQLPVVEVSVDTAVVGGTDATSSGSMAPAPSHTHTHTDAHNRPTPVFALAFNPKLRDFLATGDGQGRVQVWQLSWGLANLQPSEQQALEKLVNSSFTDTS